MLGIYKIQNKITKDLYIGSSNKIEHRWFQHKRSLKLNCHINIHLQRAWNKYGEENFEFIVIEECSKDKLLEREQLYIDILCPRYNICLEKVNTTLGIRFNLTKEQKDKISKGNKGKRLGMKASEIAKRNMSKAQMGRVSPNKGKVWSIEYKLKMSQACSGIKNGFYGKHHTKETIEKLRELGRRSKGRKNPKQSERMKEIWKKGKS